MRPSAGETVEGGELAAQVRGASVAPAIAVEVAFKKSRRCMLSPLRMEKRRVN